MPRVLLRLLRCPGLSEVVGGLGLEKLNKLMPDIIQTAERTDIAAHVRDGYIMMYIYLPGVFGDDFLTYVGPIIPSILKVGPLLHYNVNIKYFGGSLSYTTSSIIFYRKLWWPVLYIIALSQNLQVAISSSYFEWFLGAY